VLVGAAAAPIAPAAGWGIATLSTLLAFIVCIGLVQVWKHTLGAALRWLADEFDALEIAVRWIGHIRPLGPIAAAFRTVDANVFHALGWAALKSQHAWNYCANQAAASLRHIAREVEHLSTSLYHATGQLVTVVLPRWERHALRLAGHATHVAIVAVRRQIAVRLALVRHELRAVEAHAAHALHRAEHALDWSAGRVGRLDRRLESQAKRLEGLRKHFGAVAFAGLVAAALTKLGLGWLRCSNTKRTAKAVCGMDTDLLDGLLLGATLIVGTISVVEFAEELQAIEHEAIGIIHGFIREV
jgi:hypothetical protein